MSRATDALRLAERIAATRAELAELERAFFNLLGETRAGEPAGAARAVGVATGPVLAKATAGSPPGTIAEQIVALVGSQPSRTFAISEILEALPELDPKSVRGTLGRLSRAKDGIRRLGRGRYRHHPRHAGHDKTEGTE